MNNAPTLNDRDIHTLPMRFERVEGFAWHSQLPPELAAHSDNMVHPRQSRLALFEDGKPLLGRHARHDEIKENGRGAYSHWDNYLLFSTLDNSDPNSNGRRYTFRLEAETPWVLSFGSCHLNDAVVLGLGGRGLARPVVPTPTYTLSVPEALQQMAFYRNAFHPKDDEIDFCMSNSDVQIASRGRVERADVVLLEICSPFPVCFRSFILSRAQIVDRIVTPIQSMGSEYDHFANRWYFDGVIRQDEAVRLESGSKLLRMMPEMELNETLRSIIREAKIVPQSGLDLKESVFRFRDLFPSIPLIALSHNLRYMPDGRPISWPGTFYRDVNAVCGEIGLPIFNTRELVATKGVEFSLNPDLSHYTPAFCDLMADHLYKMILNELPHFSSDPHRP